MAGQDMQGGGLRGGEELAGAVMLDVPCTIQSREDVGCLVAQSRRLADAFAFRARRIKGALLAWPALLPQSHRHPRRRLAVEKLMLK
ncbi:hypothetical protein VTN96DRAFT_4657 [Rasamsonia emersonii]